MPDLNEKIWLNMYHCVNALMLTLLLTTNFLVNVVASSRSHQTDPCACLNKTLT